MYTGTHLQSIVDREQEDVGISKFIPRRAAVASSATALRDFGIFRCGKHVSGVSYVATGRTGLLLTVGNLSRGDIAAVVRKQVCATDYAKPPPWETCPSGLNAAVVRIPDQDARTPS